jgi:MtN3 and saliva related transmembrane protein
MSDILSAQNTTVVIGIAAGVLTAASMMPQVIKTIKTKTAEHVSILMLIILIGGVML